MPRRSTRSRSATSRSAPAREPLVPAVTPSTLAGPNDAVAGDTLAHLVSLYGPRAADVIACAANDADAFERIHPDGPDVWAQVRYAASHELALTVDDVVARRTTLGWRGLTDEATRERVARVLPPRAVPT